ncbi:Uncharacterized protein BM_BM14449, partial [Brugia malayi]
TSISYIAVFINSPPVFSVIDGETCKKAKSPDIGFLGEVMSQHSL